MKTSSSKAVIGLMLIAGIQLRFTLIAGTLLMILLITGSCLIENWSAAGTQMVYLAFYAGLLGLLRFDAFSVDAARRRRFA